MKCTFRFVLIIFGFGFVVLEEKFKLFCAVVGFDVILKEFAVTYKIERSVFTDIVFIFRLKSKIQTYLQANDEYLRCFFQHKT